MTLLVVVNDSRVRIAGITNRRFRSLQLLGPPGTARPGCAFGGVDSDGDRRSTLSLATRPFCLPLRYQPLHRVARAASIASAAVSVRRIRAPRLSGR